MRRPAGKRRADANAISGPGSNQAFDLAQMTAKYNPEKLRDGWNIVDGEEIFYISNPGLGLWAYEGRFKN